MLSPVDKWSLLVKRIHKTVQSPMGHKEDKRLENGVGPKKAGRGALGMLQHSKRQDNTGGTESQWGGAGPGPEHVQTPSVL